MKIIKMSVNAVGVIFALVLGGCSSHDSPIADTTGPAVSCDELASHLSLANTTIDLVTLDVGGEVISTFPDAGPVPENCVVKGTIGAYTSAYADPDTGSNAYGTRFELRLPTQWNQRFFFQGGGGLDGTVVFAGGNIPSQGSNFGVMHQTPALWRGYAVVSSDSGHQSGDTQDAFLKAGFGVDPAARVNYGYAFIGQVTPVAKQIIQQYYAQKPRYSYFLGCSKGGQEAMEVSERYADQFDGIVAGDPGFRLPHSAAGSILAVQAFAPVALANNPTGLDENGNPLLYNALSSSDMELLRTGILQACDGLDGVTDGMVFNAAACIGKFDPAVLQCSGVKNDTCLSTDQVTAVRAVFAGAKAADGSALYASFPFDGGLASQTGWPLVYLGILRGASNSALGYLITLASGSYVFSTPPDANFNVFSANLDQFSQTIQATSGNYSVSAVNYMEADSTNLDTFKKRGGKIIYFHGASDPIFSMNDTINYYQNLSGKYGSTTSNFARLFLVPGMNHCADGDYSANNFDTLAAIANWVENGVAPDSIIAKPADPTTTKLAAGTTRPLCAYPKYARYTGGDATNAGSFSCVNP